MIDCLGSTIIQKPGQIISFVDNVMDGRGLATLHKVVIGRVKIRSMSLKKIVMKMKMRNQ